MTQNQRHPIATITIALFVLLLAAMALAQWQVNTQVGQVNRRVGGELNGNNSNMGSMRYAARSQTVLLPSEVRYANWRSGALPSEIAMQANTVGPLAPNGSISYIPNQSALQSAMKTPQPQLYNPSYNLPQQQSKTDQLLPPQAGFAPSSIRYSSPPPAPPLNASTGQVPARTVSSISPDPPLVLRPAYGEVFSSGSMRYSNPPKP